MASQPFQEGAFSGTIVAASIRQQSLEEGEAISTNAMGKRQNRSNICLYFWAVCKALLAIEVVLIDTLAVAL